MFKSSQSASRIAHEPRHREPFHLYSSPLCTEKGIKPGQMSNILYLSKKVAGQAELRASSIFGKVKKKKKLKPFI